MGFLKYFFFTRSTLLSFVNRGQRRDTTGEKFFLCLFCFCLLLLLCSCMCGDVHRCSIPPRVPSPSAAWSPTRSPVTTSLWSSSYRHSRPLPGSLIRLHLPTSLCLPGPWTIISRGLLIPTLWFQAKCHLPGSGLPSPYSLCPPTLAHLYLGCFLLPGHCGPALDQTTLQTCLPPSGLQPHLSHQVCTSASGRPPIPCLSFLEQFPSALDYPLGFSSYLWMHQYLSWILFESKPPPSKSLCGFCLLIGPRWIQVLLLFPFGR